MMMAGIETSDILPAIEAAQWLPDVFEYRAISK
jgi:hypothetical protein